MSTGTADYDPAQAAIDALLGTLDVPDPGTHYVKVASLDLTGVTSSAEALAEISRLSDADADVICLQGASGYFAAITDTYGDDFQIVAESTSAHDVPLLFRAGRWRVRKKAAVVAQVSPERAVTSVVAVHIESSQKIRLLNTFPDLGADQANLAGYTGHVNVLSALAAKSGKKSIAIVAGSFGVDYSERDDAQPWWPTRTLGNLNYAYCWSYYDDAALSGLSTVRGEASTAITGGVFARKDADLAWGSTVTIDMEYADNDGVLATYLIAVKEAEEPDESEMTTTADTPPGGSYGSSTFTAASINLRITLSLAASRSDFLTVNSESGGLDIFGMQEMQNTDRADFFGSSGLAAFADIHVQPNRTRSRGCDANPVGWRRERFAYEAGSGKALLLTQKYYYEADGDRAGLMYATVAKCRDRVSGRMVHIWSMHTPPSVETGAGLPDPADAARRIPVLLASMAAMKRYALTVPEDELLVVTGDLNWDSRKNVWPQRPNVWFQEAGMIVVWQALPPTAHGTLGDRWVDYIAISRRTWAKFTNVGVVTDVATDHNPPWATIEVQPA